jgi:hypothetical protein
MTNIIHKGFIDVKSKNLFKDTGLNNFDLATTKIYNGVKPMWQQLGFSNDDSDNPSNKFYWKNIIPNDYTFKDLTGIQERTDQDSNGSYKKIVVNEDISQDWKGADNPCYPILPKINKVGVFSEEVNVNNSYGVSTAPITELDEVDDNLIFNIDFNHTTTDDLNDKTNLSKIEYNQDFEISLDDNLRLQTNTFILPDGIEKNNEEQAF